MVKFDKITLRFDEKVILKDFTLEIKKGEKVLLDAPSGRGKSSLLKSFLGFIPIESGSLYFNNEKIEHHNIQEVRKNIAWVNQNVTMRRLKVRELFKTINEFHINKEIDFDGKKKELFNHFELPLEYLDKEVDLLSGGERQRLALIIAIILDRDLYFLDEVTASLDLRMKKIVEKWIHDSNKTIVLISHDTHWDRERFKVVKW